MNTHWLRGKSVAIVGASSVLGRNLIYYLVTVYDCKVLAIDEDTTELKKLEKVDLLKSNISLYSFNTSSPKSWQSFATELGDVGIDILINCKYSLSKFSNFHKEPVASIVKSINTNYLTSIYSIKYFFPFLKKSRTPTILNIACPLSLCVNKGASSYVANIDALKKLTEMLSREYEEIYISWCVLRGVRVELYKQQEEDLEKKLDSCARPIGNMAIRIIEGLSKRRKKIILGKHAKLLETCLNYFPKTTKYVAKKFAEHRHIKTI